MNVNMIFALLFAIIIIMVVLFFGTRQMGDLTNINTQTAFYNKLNKFDDAVSSVATMSMGSEQKFEFTVPSTVEKICFVDRNNPDSNPTENWELDNIVERLITNNDYNLLVYEKDKNVPIGRKIDYLVPDENFCITSGKTLWLENKGRVVSIGE
ncbi:MAG: hypothetical protein GXO64_01630 [Candidatus Micrarchaeota archaeon]|nr:hypothetical protein [Candidatus Micrarchaeota archaeon]